METLFKLPYSVKQMHFLHVSDPSLSLQEMMLPRIWAECVGQGEPTTSKRLSSKMPGSRPGIWV